MGLILCFSPHLDDVVLSCSAKLIKEKRAGNRLRVESIFTEAIDLGGEKSLWSGFNYQERREEDEKVLKKLGAEAGHWQMLDAPFRRSTYQDWQSIVTSFAPADSVTIVEIKSRMWQIIQVQMPQEILVPLGVGGHIDHRLVFLAGLELCQEKNLWDKVLFYEDRPYVLIPGALGLRFFGLGIGGVSWFSVLRMMPAYIWESLNSTMVRSQTRSTVSRWRHIMTAVRSVFRRKTQGTNLNLKAKVTEVSSKEVSEIASLVQGYASQFGQLYGDEHNFLKSSMKYSQQMGFKPDSYCERYWQRLF